VAFGGHDEPRGAYEMVLILHADGTWIIEVVEPPRADDSSGGPT